MLGSSRRIGIVRSYPRKSQIIREDDPADHVYEVISGTLCTCKVLREGRRRQIAGFYFPGDICGLESAKKHGVTVEAITNAKVRVFKKRALTTLASSNLEVADRLLALTTRELAHRQDHLLLLLSTTAEERIIYFLMEMVHRASPREDNLIHLPMARRDIADYLGLTLETVSRTLWDFERRRRNRNLGPFHCAAQSLYEWKRQKAGCTFRGGQRATAQDRKGTAGMACLCRRQGSYAI